MKLLKGAGRFDRTCRCFQTLSWFIPFGRCSPQFLCQLFTLDTAQYLFVWGRNFQVLPILNILCLFWSLASCILTPLPQHTLHAAYHQVCLKSASEICLSPPPPLPAWSEPALLLTQATSLFPNCPSCFHSYPYSLDATNSHS